ncbi:hypothetical protein Psi02_37140 [Planotetraspora silvatica]|uniref:histidine kinase n=1 Tax=Planotetraspora silvatica TaxID=234614 RepID=A0A8J3UMU5_9ACTN|nr:sensor histidine kinase [Planotetraspora silvatica]GII47290.1 hypothetical protein Psi02_37140 [Planotetraspora silvatica]
MRTFLGDCAMVIVLAVTSALLGADPFFDTPAQRKMISVYGSADDWRLQILCWWLAALLAVAAIFARHRWPLAAMLLATACAASHLLGWPAMTLVSSSPKAVLGSDLLPLDLVVLVVLYALASAAGTRRLSLAVLVALEAGLVGIGLFGPLLDTPILTILAKTNPAKSPADKLALADPLADVLWTALSYAVVPALLLGIAWAAGDNARTRRFHLAVLQARAADLEREQEQRTALAVATERGRITRELHDVVAHGLSVMVVQAQGAQAALRRHPERSEVALTNVITTGRASLAEMRRLLGLVRTDPSLAPQPSLAALPDLIESVRSSGTPVEFAVTGEPATLPAGIELSAYRIVQEALTNALKHAPPGSRCSVDLSFNADTLHIRVADTGVAGETPVFGNGLRGIAERVNALGGTFRAGPADHGGFEVTTVLPVAVPA